MITKKITILFVILILFVSLGSVGCGSKPPKKTVKWFTFARVKSSIKRWGDDTDWQAFEKEKNFEGGSLIMDIKNSYSNSVEVPGTGKETHHFFAIDIVWKSKELRDKYYSGLITELTKLISDGEKAQTDGNSSLRTHYETILNSKSLKYRHAKTALFDMQYLPNCTSCQNQYSTDDIELTLVKRGKEWYSLN